jgi:hypothetical protein
MYQTFSSSRKFVYERVTKFISFVIAAIVLFMSHVQYNELQQAVASLVNCLYTRCIIHTSKHFQVQIVN